ncbi:hypothetical protein MIMGU_mgv1a001852mg [Erythranthe guttata]|uniref:Uncharacterized protein n=1 Tax=Erythranthe guttata TaxID=4155 RepID=A0A022R3C7_ERYGU|nr:hypothetical protein MIMGU_mgv1a001852mg [Erythranthe guttata]
MEEEDEGDVEFNTDAPISQSFNRKRKTINENPAQLPPADGPPEIAVSEFEYSVENHFKYVDKVAKLCSHPETLDPPDQADIKRISNSITFLREWRDFNYGPRIVRFACQYSSKEKDVIGGATLHQFSSASVPKVFLLKDFVMHVGGAVWALDWCPTVDCNTENHIKSEFVAVAAHPPESSHHKIGAPLTGRGAIQIWCLLTLYVKEDAASKGTKKPKPISQELATVNDPNKVLKPRGRPRKKPITDTVEKIDRPRGRPRKNPINDTVKKMDTDPQFAESLAIEYPTESPNDCSQKTEHANALLLAGPKGGGNKSKSQKGAQHSIPVDVELPRMMLCLAHNGKVAWDLKWRPVDVHGPASRNIMGYLAVLLGNGALEVWEVPLPHAVKLVYPASQERIDPRFIKLKPVFRCSKLKCGDRQSIPLTLEWSVSAPYDTIVAGCHDGVVALWKFSATDSLTETRPLLSFSADTGPIRTLAWAPNQTDLESANVIVTAGHKGFKFWDIRDPFRPLWDHAMQGVTYGLSWLRDPRCVFGSVDDGTLWFHRLENTASDIPITGKCVAAATKQGFHSFDCSSFSIWNVQASPLTGVVAYCGEAGTTLCFQPTARSVKDPSRNRRTHLLCGSLLEEEDALIVATPSTSTSHSRRYPGMKRSGGAKDLEKKFKEQINNEQPLAICWRGDLEETKKQEPKSKETNKDQLKNDNKREVFPGKNVAIHRVRWNANKGSENWLCYGGAAGLLRCQQIDSSLLQ